MSTHPAARAIEIRDHVEYLTEHLNRTEGCTIQAMLAARLAELADLVAGLASRVGSRPGPQPRFMHGA